MRHGVLPCLVRLRPATDRPEFLRGWICADSGDAGRGGVPKEWDGPVFSARDIPGKTVSAVLPVFINLIEVVRDVQIAVHRVLKRSRIVYAGAMVAHSTKSSPHPNPHSGRGGEGDAVLVQRAVGMTNIDCRTDSTLQLALRTSDFPGRWRWCCAGRATLPRRHNPLSHHGPTCSAHVRGFPRKWSQNR
jgi:hypothetical protein